MRRFLCIFGLMALWLTKCPALASEALTVSASSAILIEAGSGRTLFAQDADTPRPMASTTKIMTALLTLEHAALDEDVVASEHASGVSGTSIYLGVGERMSVRDLLLGLLLRSGNDAAVALAEYVGGSVEGFVRMMNERAKALGVDAHFENPHGLDEATHRASARAMAEIAREALGIPAFRTLVTTKQATIPWAGSPYNRVLTNKNKLLSQYEGASGVKTGFTKKAGRCLVFSAKRNGMELVGALLNAPNWFEDAKLLLDDGFTNYHLVQQLYQYQTLGELPVDGGLKQTTRIVAGRSLAVPLAAGEISTVSLETVESLRAPVEMGMVVGRVVVRVDGVVAGETPAIAFRRVPRRTFASAFWHVVRAFNPVALSQIERLSLQ